MAPGFSNQELDRKIILLVAGVHLALLVWVQLDIHVTKVKQQELVLELEERPRQTLAVPKPVVSAVAAAPNKSQSRKIANSHDRDAELGSPQPVVRPAETPPLVQPIEAQAIHSPVTEPARALSPPSSSAAKTAAAAPVPNNDADYKAAYLHNAKPPYPEIAFRLKLEGEVRIQAEVLEDGSVGRVSILKSSGHDLLDRSAFDTIQKWHFKPAHRDGAAVHQLVTIPVSFNLVSLANGAR